MTRILRLMAIPLIVVAANGGCSKDDAPTPATTEALLNDMPAISKDDLYGEWATGRFTKLSRADILGNVRKYMSVDDGYGLTVDMLASFEKAVAVFLTAYGSTDFEKYLAFRDPMMMAGADDPLVRQRIEAMTRTWNPDWGEPPSDGPSATRFVWRMYIEGELSGVSGGASIERVKWTSCHVHVDFLRREAVDPDEWNQSATTPSHFLHTLEALPVAAALPSEVRPFIANRLSAVAIADRDGELVYADFEIIQKAGDLPPHPLMVRFVHDRSTGRWLPHNIVKIENEPPLLLIW